MSGGFGDLLGTSYGVALTVGGVAAIAAYLVGLFGTRPNVQRLLALGREIASSEGPPAPDLTAKVPPLQDLIKMLARIESGTARRHGRRHGDGALLVVGARLRA